LSVGKTVNPGKIFVLPGGFPFCVLVFLYDQGRSILSGLVFFA
jgi:hypothetical protein